MFEKVITIVYIVSQFALFTYTAVTIFNVYTM